MQNNSHHLFCDKTEKWWIWDGGQISCPEPVLDCTAIGGPGSSHHQPDIHSASVTQTPSTKEIQIYRQCGACQRS